MSRCICSNIHFGMPLMYGFIIVHFIISTALCFLNTIKNNSIQKLSFFNVTNVQQSVKVLVISVNVKFLG